jgi:geranylgeranyl diphosphate synthase, type II
MPDSFASYHQLFNSYLENQHFNRTPAELYEPVNYILSMGGKRIRPMLVMLGCEVMNGKVEDALPVAFAFELFHNFTLVHDDIMDNAPVRRGKKTVHQQFNVNTAILSGDVMMIWCYEYLSKSRADTFGKLFKVFNDTAIKVCEGQQMDMDFEHRLNVSEAEYLKMIEYKTSVLIAGCLKAGALSGNASDVVADEIYRFGLNIGLTFQLQDDILDAFGDSDKVGKETGGDIKNNKKTLLLIKALELANEEQRKKILMLLNASSENKVNEMLELFSKTGVREYVELKASQFQKNAFEMLEKLELETGKKRLLAEFADNLLNRKY